MQIPWVLSFWMMIAAYVVHVIDESLLGGSFSELHPDLDLYVFCGFLSCSAAIVHASGSVRCGGDRFGIHRFPGALHSRGKGTSQEKGRDWTGSLVPCVHL